MLNQTALGIYLDIVFGLAAIAVLFAAGALVYLVADQRSHSDRSKPAQVYARPARIHSRRQHAPRLNHPAG